MNVKPAQTAVKMARKSREEPRSELSSARSRAAEEARPLVLARVVQPEPALPWLRTPKSA